jgi:hypothetical protein
MNILEDMPSEIAVIVCVLRWRVFCGAKRVKYESITYMIIHKAKVITDTE